MKLLVKQRLGRFRSKWKRSWLPRAPATPTYRRARDGPAGAVGHRPRPSVQRHHMGGQLIPVTAADEPSRGLGFRAGLAAVELAKM
jgi:hypothetical protein